MLSSRRAVLPLRPTRKHFECEMNRTQAVPSLSIVCATCEASNGFTSADLRALVIVVVFLAVALVGCYVGVLWFAIRTRLISADKSLIVLENVVTNQAFNEDEDDVLPANNAVTSPAAVIMHDEKERY